MRKTRIYIPQPVFDQDSLLLDMAKSHRLAHVLRMRVGDQLQLFDGNGREWLAVISELGKKQVTVSIKEQLAITTESPLAIHLGQALLRNQKMELVLQKSVELGVTDITPIITERVNVSWQPEKANKRLDHWQEIIISATEQSHRNVLPVLHPPVMFAEWVGTINAEQKIIWDPDGKQTVADLACDVKTVATLIGPEGGFEQAEIDFAAANHFYVCRLGPRVLRTETMAVTVLSLMQYRSGDFS